MEITVKFKSNEIEEIMKKAAIDLFPGVDFSKKEITVNERYGNYDVIITEPDLPKEGE